MSEAAMSGRSENTTTGRELGMPSWIVAEACTLPEPDRPLRLAEFATLFDTSLRQVERRDQRLLRLRLSGDAEQEVRDLTARESACCSFFAFRVGREGEEVVVDIGVPVARVDVLDGLERQARHHVTGRGTPAPPAHAAGENPEH